jgi:uncharacterized RDD family membrane protein YckC
MNRNPTEENHDLRGNSAEEAETLKLDQDQIETVLDAGSSTRQTTVLQPGIRFGAYTLTCLLGRGGFGEVWEAENLETGRRLALKVLTATARASPEAVERFKREGELAASLNHPNCVYVFGAEEIEGYLAISMELMPGGTLQNLLDRNGRLPFKRAVDYSLEVLDGLDAANRMGVLHRDVKPANCLLDRNGRIKVGDFGLSKSLKDSTHLTSSGKFIGTPAYSSPEQVRGRDVDFRTDMYSLGATLYALLTGKPPFGGRGAGEVLARIVSEEPPRFAELGVEVPIGLQRVVQRLLAKDKEKRYVNYEKLRAALMPYASEGLMPGNLAKRFIAFLIDGLFITIIVLFLFPLYLGGVISLSVHQVAIFTWYFLYFAIPSKLWGQSLGSLIFGLRVTTATGASITWRQALVRASILVSFLSIPGVIFAFYFPGSLLSLVAAYCFPFVLLCTMRRSNDYAGIHEMLSGTRVKAVNKKAYNIAVPQLPPPTTTRSTERPPRQFGPYRETHVIWETPSEALLEARDDVLHRKVWIHHFSDKSQSRSMESLAAIHPGQLSWLQGSRKLGECWDSYDAPSGANLYRWVRTAGKLSWAEMREIFPGLLTELQLRLDNKDLPRELSVCQIWIASSGQAKLLDFPAELNEIDEDEASTIAHDNWQSFLHQLILFGMTGKLITIEQLDRKIPKVPMPDHARSLISRLCSQEERFESPVVLADRIRNLRGGAVKVTRMRRVVSIALMSAFPSFMLISALILLPLIYWMGSSFDSFATDAFHLNDMVMISNELEKIPNNKEAQIKRTTIRKILAYRMRSRFWQDFIIKQQTKETQDVVASALAEYPNVSEEEVAEARRVLAATDDPRFIQSEAMSFQESLDAMLSVVHLFSFAYLILIVIPGIASAFIFRGGLILYLTGITAQTGDGEKASRLRCIWRALIVWSPMLITLIGAIIGLFGFPLKMLELSSIIIIILWVPLTAGAIYAVVSPERGIQDRLAGTHLVPR